MIRQPGRVLSVERNLATDYLDDATSELLSERPATSISWHLADVARTMDGTSVGHRNLSTCAQCRGLL